MKIAAITRVRNECDIVEAFVRHTAAFVDRLYIVDNASTDSTPEILRHLGDEGLPLVFGQDPDSSHYQGPKTTALLRQALADETWDFVLPLDGDEFIRAANRAALENSIGAADLEQPGYFCIATYSPTDRDNFLESDPLRRIVHRVELSPKFVPDGGKIVVPGAMARSKSMAIDEGNHQLFVDGRAALGSPLASVSLAHFPIRSIEQFVSRAAVTHLAWISRADFHAQWVWHVQKFFDRLKSNAPVTAFDLIDAAYVYAHQNTPSHVHSVRADLVRDPLMPAYDRLRHADLIKIDVLPRILEAAERTAIQLREARIALGR